jgi:hypothetical protein
MPTAARSTCCRARPERGRPGDPTVRPGPCWGTSYCSRCQRYTEIHRRRRTDLRWTCRSFRCSTGLERGTSTPRTAYPADSPRTRRACSGPAGDGDTGACSCPLSRGTGQPPVGVPGSGARRRPVGQEQCRTILPTFVDDPRQTIELLSIRDQVLHVIVRPPQVGGTLFRIPHPSSTVRLSCSVRTGKTYGGLPLLRTPRADRLSAAHGWTARGAFSPSGGEPGRANEC